MKRLLAFVTIFALTAAPVATRLEAATGPGLAVPISGVAEAPGVGSFNGTFNIQRFVSSGGNVVAQGVLTGIVTNATTGVTQSIVQTISMPVQFNQAAAAAAAPISAQQRSGSCDILHLVLGPLHLNLLGLVIDLNQVMLDITAQQGPGNLLGNLLCAITGLLDNNDSGSTIANLLNQVLAILQGL